MARTVSSDSMFAIKLIFVAVKLIAHRNHHDEYLAIRPIGLGRQRRDTELRWRRAGHANDHKRRYVMLSCQTHSDMLSHSALNGPGGVTVK